MTNSGSGLTTPSRAMLLTVFCASSLTNRHSQNKSVGRFKTKALIWGFFYFGLFFLRDKTCFGKASSFRGEEKIMASAMSEIKQIWWGLDDQFLCTESNSLNKKMLHLVQESWNFVGWLSMSSRSCKYHYFWHSHILKADNLCVSWFYKNSKVGLFMNTV